MDRNLIERFAAGGERLRATVAGLSRDDLLAHPGPGDWSIQQVVIHLADSDAIAIDRMKRILTEDNPSMLSADESAYAQRLYCDDQSIDDAVLLFAVGRRQFARVLRKLADSGFQRFGTHNQRGKITLEEMVIGYIDHLEHHLRFLSAEDSPFLCSLCFLWRYSLTVVRLATLRSVRVFRDGGSWLGREELEAGPASFIWVDLGDLRAHARTKRAARRSHGWTPMRRADRLETRFDLDHALPPRIQLHSPPLPQIK